MKKDSGFSSIRISVIMLIWITAVPCISGQQGKVLTQYLFPEFSEGNVIFRNGSSRKSMLNFNLLTGKIVYYQDKKYFDLVNSDVVDTIFLNDRKFVYDEQLWLEVLVTGSLPLFRKYTGALMSPPKQGGYGTTTQTGSVTSISTMQTQLVTYDIKLPDGYTVDLSVNNYVKVDGVLKAFLNERQLIKILPEKESEIKLFVRKNKTDFDNAENLTALIRSIR